MVSASKEIDADQVRTLNGYSVYWQIYEGLPRIWIARNEKSSPAERDYLSNAELIAYICAYYNVALDETHRSAINWWRLKQTLLRFAPHMFGLILILALAVRNFGFGNLTVSFVGYYVIGATVTYFVTTQLARRYGDYSALINVGYTGMFLTLLVMGLILRNDFILVALASLVGFYVSMLKYPYSGQQFMALTSREKLARLCEMYLKTPAKVGVFTYAGIQLIKIAAQESQSFYYIPAFVIGLMVLVAVIDFGLDEYRSDSWLSRDEMVEHPSLLDRR